MLDSDSFSSNVSLPSLTVTPSRNDKLFSSFNDFSGSIPTYHGRSIDIWGTDDVKRMPLSRYGSLFEDISRQESLQELERQASAHLEEKASEAQRESKRPVRRSSLLGMGYQYQSEKDLLKTTKKHPVKVDLKPAKKISKHSTTIRKLKPPDETKKKLAKKQKEAKTIEHTRIPGPLPRVLQRAKIQRMITKAQMQDSAQGDLPAHENQRRKSLRKALSLKDMGKEVISAIRYDTLSPHMGIKHWDKYFGDISKSEFYRQYHIAGRNLQLYAKDEDLPMDKKSPRARYLRIIAQRNLTPLPLLLRKETVRDMSGLSYAPLPPLSIA